MGNCISNNNSEDITFIFDDGTRYMISKETLEHNPNCLLTELYTSHRNLTPEGYIKIRHQNFKFSIIKEILEGKYSLFSRLNTKDLCTFQKELSYYNMDDMDIWNKNKKYVSIKSLLLSLADCGCLFLKSNSNTNISVKESFAMESITFDVSDVKDIDNVIKLLNKSFTNQQIDNIESYVEEHHYDNSIGINYINKALSQRINPNIISLSIYCESFSSRDITDFCKVIQLGCLPKLERLELSGRYTSPEIAQCVINTIRSRALKQLTYLSFEENQLPSIYIEDFFSCLYDDCCPLLQELILSNNEIKYHAMVKFFNCCKEQKFPRLKRLELASCQLSPDCFVCLLNILKQQYLSNLEDLDIAYNPVDSDELNALINIFAEENYISLKYIHLEGISIIIDPMLLLQLKQKNQLLKLTPERLFSVH
ncbi:hypothetical protein WA158_007797 [Blastocystis sp. Blastoise]